MKTSPNTLKHVQNMAKITCALHAAYLKNNKITHIYDTYIIFFPVR